MKCSGKGKGNCRAGTEDVLWLIGYIYCDHAEEHKYDPTCNVICKLNPDAECIGMVASTPVMIKRKAPIPTMKKRMTLFDT